MTCNTQMHLARQGLITDQMTRVAEREELAPEVVRHEGVITAYLGERHRAA